MVAACLLMVDCASSDEWPEETADTPTGTPTARGVAVSSSFTFAEVVTSSPEMGGGEVLFKTM